MLKTVDPFMVGVDNVCAWGLGPLLDSVAERLEKVAREAVVGA